MLPKLMIFNKARPASKPVVASILGLVVGLLGIALSSIPLVTSLEHDLGLDWLFKLRGDIPASTQVIVAAMDRESSDALGYKNIPRKWDRKTHAELVNHLTGDNARAIGFDVHFAEPHAGNQDEIFAQALKKAGNTVLFENLFTFNQEHYRTEKREPPIEVLNRAALDTAPFALPKVPAKVSQAWLFKSGAGDSPTLPMVLLHVYMEPLQQQFLELLHQSFLKLKTKEPSWLIKDDVPSLPSEKASLFRRLFYEHPQLGRIVRDELNSLPSISSVEQESLRSWVYALTQGDSIILNLYGPARSVHTEPINRLLQQDSTVDVADKSVFVGFSEILQPEQKDGFYTSFTGEDGIDISGVELMATTFSNLLQREAIQPASTATKLISLFLIGFILTAIAYMVTGGLSVLFAVLAAVGWLSIASNVFTQHQLWLPTTTILLFQIPIGLLLALVWQFRRNRETKALLSNQFKRFVAPELVDHLDETGSISQGSLIPAVCLFTDMESFTPLGEALDPWQLQEQLNEYFGELQQPVIENGGRVADMTGDSMLCLWTQGTPSDQVTKASTAALKMLALQKHQGIKTRMGIHLGEIYLGTLGAENHLEYRAVGDTVNTAKRLESLNKKLGTNILISDNALIHAQTLVTRRLGRFQLKGKTVSIDTHEVQGIKGNTVYQIPGLSEAFESALRLYESGFKEQAKLKFDEITCHFGDQASEYYSTLCQDNAK